MSDQAKHDKQAVIDAVVGGDISRLASALKRVSRSSPSGFLGVCRDLLETEQREQFFIVDTCSLPYTYHADGMVFGATYTNGDVFFRRAHPSGTGLALVDVQRTVAEVRSEYEADVMKKVGELKERLIELDLLLDGHSAVDHSISGLARADLTKGQALLLAAITPNK
ncbi:hypothetical protein H7A76_31435 [Pseudomonas sp. MSSRFD41]|uniref:hypothetical protein n=1 Tax=Pseudomonas sp. MSSRFD41 TaxID=1310370 RepID=UPI00163AD401|nr:hypothetical protein [Pseudomonas sp. MSSRFD41]MBC2659965.1 hypothetical protein [Pseudomonas sp. MSSRFD41]